MTFAQEAERRRVAYEIHDGLAQLIVSGAQHLDTAADVMRDEPARAGEELARGQERLQRAIVETRRILMSLRPSPCAIPASASPTDCAVADSASTACASGRGWSVGGSPSSRLRARASR